ncbi:MAG: hypothetical protein QOG68_1387 [Solirubrobacteraceae bacterium]|nr:hypothetical protein [Solirubrobacteraceae bacterium]
MYRTHVRAVYAFFAYSVRREAAEDLTSTTFERVLRAWDRFDPARASERTWVLSIARNALIDHYRRERLRTTTSTDEQPALLDSLAHSDDPLARQLAVDGLVGWLAELPAREQEILALRYGADLSARDIAGLTDLSEANVHQLVSRALRKLRAIAEQREATGSE